MNMVPNDLRSFIQGSEGQKIEGFDLHSPLEVLEGYTLAQYKASTPDQVVAMIKEAEEKVD